MKCLRCNGEMEHLGHESLQLVQYGFFTGHLSNLFYRADAPSLSERLKNE